jgi:hypothetical protein
MKYQQENTGVNYVLRIYVLLDHIGVLLSRGKALD